MEQLFEDPEKYIVADGLRKKTRLWSATKMVVSLPPFPLLCPPGLNTTHPETQTGALGYKQYSRRSLVLLVWEERKGSFWHSEYSMEIPLSFFFISFSLFLFPFLLSCPLSNPRKAVTEAAAGASRSQNSKGRTSSSPINRVVIPREWDNPSTAFYSFSILLPRGPGHWSSCRYAWQKVTKAPAIRPEGQKEKH